MRPLKPDRIEHRASIIHPLLQRRHTRRPVGEACAALVETNQASE
jgi:hypothetical protein